MDISQSALKFIILKIVRAWTPCKPNKTPELTGQDNNNHAGFHLSQKSKLQTGVSGHTRGNSISDNIVKEVRI